MRHIGRLVVLAMVIAGFLLPGLSSSVAAQDASWCALADGQPEGTPIQGYTVVYGTGGSGSQIVLGYGDTHLSGGSGNDVLCAWGNGNTLDGGSGNDLLVALDGDNTLLGGSGNDTLIGVEGDTFNGGSGRNEVIAYPAIVESEPSVTLTLGPGINMYSCFFYVEIADFTPGTTHDVEILLYPRTNPGQPQVAQTSSAIIGGDGTATNIHVGMPAVLDGEIQAVVNGISSERVFMTCSS